MKEPVYSNDKGIAEKAFLRKLASRIREIRTNAGVTQDQVYADTNIHIGRIETGKFNISINTLYRICAYFKISVKDFFDQINKT